MAPRKKKIAPRTVVKEEPEDLDPRSIIPEAARQLIDNLEEEGKNIKASGLFFFARHHIEVPGNMDKQKHELSFML